MKNIGKKKETEKESTLQSHLPDEASGEVTCFH